MVPQMSACPCRARITLCGLVITNSSACAEQILVKGLSLGLEAGIDSVCAPIRVSSPGYVLLRRSSTCWGICSTTLEVYPEMALRALLSQFGALTLLEHILLRLSRFEDRDLHKTP